MKLHYTLMYKWINKKTLCTPLIYPFREAYCCNNTYTTKAVNQAQQYLCGSCLNGPLTLTVK